jgi:nicotinamidase-related amidase
MQVLTKNSIHPAFDTGLDAWLDAHPDVATFVVVGDCTDLCTYQTAMYLKLRANARQLPQRVAEKGIVDRESGDSRHAYRIRSEYLPAVEMSIGRTGEIRR